MSNSDQSKDANQLVDQDTSKKDDNTLLKDVKSSEHAAKKQKPEKPKSNETQKPVKDKKSGTVKAKKSQQKSSFPWITTFALVLVLVLGSANYWLYQQGEQLKYSINQMSQQQSRSNQLIADLGEEVNDTISQQGTVVTQIQQNEEARQSMMASLDQMSEQLKALATTKGKDPLFWRVAEVEYLLSVANHRLVLERDVITAKAALQDADTRLRSIGDPGLIPVREKITQEIIQLENVNMPDIPGMAAQISSLVDSLEQLPFVTKDLSLDSPSRDEGDKEFSGFSNFVKQVWDDLANGLFRVQRSDQPIEPLLPLQEKQYLMHNLELKLDQARIALLKTETQLFQKNLADIERWVQKYFDQDATAVSNLLNTIQSLKTVELHPALPDVSASLRELRSWLNQQKNLAYRSGQSRLAHVQAESTNP